MPIDVSPRTDARSRIRAELLAWTRRGPRSESFLLGQYEGCREGQYPSSQARGWGKERKLSAQAEALLPKVMS